MIVTDLKGRIKTQVEGILTASEIGRVRAVYQDVGTGNIARTGTTYGNTGDSVTFELDRVSDIVVIPKLSGYNRNNSGSFNWAAGKMAVRLDSDPEIECGWDGTQIGNGYRAAFDMSDAIKIEDVAAGEHTVYLRWAALSSGTTVYSNSAAGAYARHSIAVIVLDKETTVPSLYGSSEPYSGVSLKKSSNQTHTTSGVAEYVTWDVEEWDTDNYFDSAVSNTNIVIPKDGKYRITAQVNFLYNTTGTRSAIIEVNGEATPWAAHHEVDPVTGTVGAATYAYISKTLNLSADDVVKIAGGQNSGGSLDMYSSYMFVQVERVK